MAVKVYEKGVSTQLSEEFESTDFDCACQLQDCTQTFVDENLVRGLEEMITIFPIITITSGFRCKAHNAATPGSSPNSQHCLGKAADIKSPFGTPHHLLLVAARIDVFANGGLGLYRSWLHCDVRGHTARWTAPSANVVK